jgi:hypothetical protein
MKLLATLDYWDGSPGKTKECFGEDITGSAIIRSLMGPGVASITFTRPPDLLKLSHKEENF